MPSAGVRGARRIGVDLGADRPNQELALLLVLLVVAARLFWLLAPPSASGIDYYQFWVVGQSAASLGSGDIYAEDRRLAMAQFGAAAAREQRSTALAEASAQRPIIETFSTPLLYTTVHALASGRYDTDLTVFCALATTASISAVLLLGSMMGWPLTQAMLLVLALLIASEPMASDLRVGNVNQFQLLGVASYLLAIRGRAAPLRMILAGTVLAVVVLFKPTLGILYPIIAVAWLASGRWRALLVQTTAGAVVGAAMIAISSAHMGDGWAWRHWLDAMPDLASVSDISVEIGNFSPMQAILEAGGPTLAMPVTIVLAGALAACIAWSAHRLGIQGRVETYAQLDGLAVGLACCLPLLSLRLVWLHYFVLATPLVIALLTPRAPVLRSWPALGIATVGLMGVLGRPVQVLVPSESATFMVACYSGGVAILMTLGLIALLGLPGKAQPRSLPLR